MNRVRIDDIPLEDGDDEFLKGVFEEADGLERARDRERTRRKRARRKRKKPSDGDSPKSELSNEDAED